MGCSLLGTVGSLVLVWCSIVSILSYGNDGVALAYPPSSGTVGATNTTIGSIDAASPPISGGMPLELDDCRGVVRLFSVWASLYAPLTDAVHNIILEHERAIRAEGGPPGYRDDILEQLQLCNKNSPLRKAGRAGGVQASTAAGQVQPVDKKEMPWDFTKIWDDNFILEALRLISPILRYLPPGRVSIPTDDAAKELDRSIQGALYIRHQMFHGIAPLETERVSNCMRFLNTIAKSMLPAAKPDLVTCIACNGMVTLRWQTIVAICLDGMISLIVQEVCRRSWTELDEAQRKSVIDAASSKKIKFSTSLNETVLGSDVLEVKTLRMLLSPKFARQILSNFKEIDANVATAIMKLNWAALQEVRNFVAHAYMDAGDEEWIAKWPLTRDITYGIKQLGLSTKANKLEKALHTALNIAGFSVETGKLTQVPERAGLAPSTGIACKFDEQKPAEVASAVFRVRITPPLVGRKVEQERILAACRSGSGNTPVLITGCSGMGKTALAMTAVQKLSQKEHKIRSLLLPGSSFQSAEKALAWFGCSGNTIDTPEKQMALASAKCRLNEGGWLVVIDSLTDPAILDLLPLKRIQVRR